MASQEIQDLAAKISSVKPASDADRQLLYKAARDLAARSEDVFEATSRIVYAVGLPLQTQYIYISFAEIRTNRCKLAAKHLV